MLIFSGSKVCYHFVQAADCRVSLRVLIRVALSFAEQGAHAHLLRCITFLSVVADEQDGFGICVQLFADDGVALS